MTEFNQAPSISRTTTNNMTTHVSWPPKASNVPYQPTPGCNVASSAHNGQQHSNSIASTPLVGDTTGVSGAEGCRQIAGLTPDALKGMLESMSQEERVKLLARVQAMQKQKRKGQANGA